MGSTVPEDHGSCMEPPLRGGHQPFLKVQVKEDWVDGLSFLFVASFSSCFLQIGRPSITVVIGCMASGLLHFSRVLQLMFQALTKFDRVRGSRSSKAFSFLSFAFTAIPALGKHDGALVKNIGSEKVNRREFSNIKMDPLWTNVVGSLGDEGQDIGIQPVYDQMTKRVLEDISNMGLVVEGVLNPISKEHILGCNREEEIIDMVENERNLSWVAEVDRANGTCDAEDHYFGEGYEEM
ncbi:hypothetical protein V6N13_138231 [Hibiscus sabdariffa]